MQESPCPISKSWTFPNRPDERKQENVRPRAVPGGNSERRYQRSDAPGDALLSGGSQRVLVLAGDPQLPGIQAFRERTVGTKPGRGSWLHKPSGSFSGPSGPSLPQDSGLTAVWGLASVPPHLSLRPLRLQADPSAFLFQALEMEHPWVDLLGGEPQGKPGADLEADLACSGELLRMGGVWPAPRG